MAEKKPIPVRLPPETIERLDRASAALNAGSRTAVIKLCLSSFLDHYEKAGWNSLVPNWQDIDIRMTKRLVAEKKADDEKYTTPDA